MSREKLYRSLLDSAKKNYIAEPLIVGGIPRDLYRKKINQTNDDYFKKDVDITTNDPESLRLAVSFASDTNSPFNIFEDSHSSVYVGDLVFDFSSNYISKRAVRYIESELGISDKKMFEVYSRDFTINCLHKPLLESSLIDLTKTSLEDIENKVIKTVAPPQITLMDDKRRAWRALRFVARFGYSIDDITINYLRRHGHFFMPVERNKISEKYVSRIVDECLEYNPELTIESLRQLNMLSFVPLIGEFKKYIMQNNLIPEYLDGAKLL